MNNNTQTTQQQEKVVLEAEKNEERRWSKGITSSKAANWNVVERGSSETSTNSKPHLRFARFEWNVTPTLDEMASSFLNRYEKLSVGPFAKQGNY